MDLVTIRKYDEAHIKIDCDPGIIMELSDRFTFDVPGAKFSPAYRNRMWDGKIRLLNTMSCLLYKGLSEEVERFCTQRSYDVEYEESNADTEFSLIEARSFAKTLNLKHEPRDYQLDAFVHAIRKRRAILLSPTGSGKSLMIYLLTRYYDVKTLIIVPTISLVHQMTSDFEDYGLEPGSIHKIMSGKEKNTDDSIVISTWQSIYKMPKSWFDQFDVVIGDEVHLFKAKSLSKIMSNLNQCSLRFGFTGTLDGTQTNEMVLVGLFGPALKVTTTMELINREYLSDFKIKSLILKYPDDLRKSISGVDYQTEIDWIVCNPKRNNFIKNLALSLKGNTLLLFQFIDKQGKPLYDMIKSAAGDRPVYFIAGPISGEERERIRHSIEVDENAILVASAGTTSTGINIRNLHNIIFASPSKTRIRNLQAIGRVLRKSESKTIATLYDIADDLSWKKKPNYTLNHYIERIKIYSEEGFDYKTYLIDLK